MNNYGNVLLKEYYGLRSKELSGIVQIHVDYVETFPKSNGSYSSHHTDIDSSAGGNDSGNGCCDNGTGNDSCDAVWGVCGIICCCAYFPNILEGIECFGDICC